jgi:hypothetical protein
MHRTALLAAALTAGLAWPVFAQVTPEGYTDESFCTADYSPGETDDRYSSEFGEMDLNDDGMVSQDEYIKCRKTAAEV